MGEIRRSSLIGVGQGCVSLATLAVGVWSKSLILVALAPGVGAFFVGIPTLLRILVGKLEVKEIGFGKWAWEGIVLLGGTLLMAYLISLPSYLNWFTLLAGTASFTACSLVFALLIDRGFRELFWKSMDRMKIRVGRII